MLHGYNATPPTPQSQCCVYQVARILGQGPVHLYVSYDDAQKLAHSEGYFCVNIEIWGLGGLARADDVSFQLFTRVFIPNDYASHSSRQSDCRVKNSFPGMLAYNIV